MLRNRRSLAARQREMRKRQPARRGPGRPPLLINGEDVRLLARRGYGWEEIASLLHCCPNTLRTRFLAEFEEGQAWLRGLLKQICYQLAMAGHWEALLWQLRDRGLFQEEEKPRTPRRSRKPAGTSRRAAAYQPFHNRYRAHRAPRRRPSAPVPPIRVAPAPSNPPRAMRGPWINVEFAM